MAGRDNVIFKASIASGTAAGTVVPLTLLYGVENVRQGYGSAKLKNARAFYVGTLVGYGVPIEIKNSNWIDSAGLIAQAVAGDAAVNRDSLSFMRGRDKDLAPNTSWIISATLSTATTAATDVYVILEIEYSSVEGVNTEKAAGSPVFKKCSNASVTGSAGTVVPIGTFDNLLQDVDYVLSEASAILPSANGAMFLVMEGFSNQRGLTRIIPIKSTGLADQVEGSVVLKKQTYNLSIIPTVALSSAPVTIGLEMIASKN